MGVRDKRRAPFAWITLEALQQIRRELPVIRQPGARDALLALAEAASNRRDGQHQAGDPLKLLAGLSGLSERRLRAHLRDLEALGLIAIEARRDERGANLPSLYTLCDSPQPDESSDRGARTSDRGDGPHDDPDDESSDPARASKIGLQEVDEKALPSLPSDGAATPSAGEGEQGIVDFDPHNLVWLRRIA